MTSHRDNNGVPVESAMWNTSGVLAFELKADETLHELDTADGSSGTDVGEDKALRDENFATSLLAVSSAGDGAIVPLYANSSGELLIQSS